MEPQRIKKIKESLYDMSLDELQDMSDDLNSLISVLITRQVAVEDEILERLETAFGKWHLKKKSGMSALFVWRKKLQLGVLIHQQK